MSPLFFLLTALGAVHYYFAFTADFHYTHQFEVLNSCNMRISYNRITLFVINTAKTLPTVSMLNPFEAFLAYFEYTRSCQ